MLIVQGALFLARYRKLSDKDGLSREEVEYNFGRGYHSIGQSSDDALRSLLKLILAGVLALAIEHYERVLASVERRMKESEDPEVRQAFGPP